MKNANTQPQAINPGEILKHFFEHSPISDSKGYELLGHVSDEELDFFDMAVANSELAKQPTESVIMAGAVSKSSGHRVLIKAARYDDQPNPMIAMAVFDMDKSTPENQVIESFALFTDEGKGFWPIQFNTYKADDAVALAVAAALK